MVCGVSSTEHTLNRSAGQNVFRLHLEVTTVSSFSEGREPRIGNVVFESGVHLKHVRKLETR